MKIIIRTIALLITIAPLAIRAQEVAAHPVKPLLWKIEGGDLKKLSYLFGTIHLGGGALNKLHPTAQKAFDESEILLTEVPMDAKTQMGIAMKVMRKDGITLADSIGADLSKQLDDELKAINDQRVNYSCPRVPLPTCPLRDSVAPYFPPAGAGISFALAAPMATIFSIMP